MSRYAYAILLSLVVIGCNKQATTTAPDNNSSAPLAPAPAAIAELKIEDTEKGSGPTAANGDMVYVLYRGMLMNGTEFDSNMSDKLEPKLDKDPLSVVIGMGSVIKGWDEGLVGVQDGTVRVLTIPAAKAYGDAGSGEKVPPKADLKFIIKVLKVAKSGAPPEITAKTLDPGSGPAITENSTVNLKYTGKYLNGKLFDKRDSIPPTPFKKLINGFSDALVGLKKGGRRRIVIPPAMAQVQGIQGNQYLVFEVEVLDVK